MNSELEQLIQLQALDLQIRELTRQKDDFPRRIDLLELEAAKVEQELQRNQSDAENLRKERRRLEGEVEALRPKLSKYKEQLMTVKTNKEYTAMQHEIEACNKEISAKEDDVIVVMEKIEATEKAIVLSQQTCADQRTSCARQQAELGRQAQGIEDQINGLLGERGRVLVGVSNGALALYTKVAEARRGVALAEARNQSCQVCHVILRPQMFNEIKKNQGIMTCDSCNRILYYIPPPV